MDLKLEMQYIMQTLPLRIEFLSIDEHSDDDSNFEYSQAGQQTKKKNDMDQ